MSHDVLEYIPDLEQRCVLPKLPEKLRYLFIVLSVTFIYTAIAYLILRPPAWRAHLLNLLSRAFAGFTAAQSSNGFGWVVSVIASSSFMIVFTIILIGLVRGRNAMVQHW